LTIPECIATPCKLSIRNPKKRNPVHRRTDTGAPCHIPCALKRLESESSFGWITGAPAHNGSSPSTPTSKGQYVIAIACNGVILVATTVLVMSGAEEIVRPYPIASTLSDLGLPVAKLGLVGRSFGALEIVLAAFMVVSRSRWAVLAVIGFGLSLAGPGCVSRLSLGSPSSSLFFPPCYCWTAFVSGEGKQSPLVSTDKRRIDGGYAVLSGSLAGVWTQGYRLRPCALRRFRFLDLFL